MAGTGPWRTRCRWAKLAPILAVAVAALTGGLVVRRSATFSSREIVPPQVAQGRRLYSLYCASCHGDHGEGSYQVPALVGSARRYCIRFPDAQRLYEWVAERMPPEDVLQPREHWNILAFLLRANRELPPSLTLGPDTASRIVFQPSCWKLK
ncbi:MAG: cytochrome c [Armatimonadota bacterium]|nr:cytochrome c [Armatimonadota bacterium]MDR7440153.1 cytochrome c [Armatimonadota bacterium]